MKNKTNLVFGLLFLLLGVGNLYVALTAPVLNGANIISLIIGVYISFRAYQELKQFKDAN